MFARFTLLVILSFYCCSAFSQSFQNLDFESICSDEPKSICHWKKAWVSKGVTCSVVQKNGNQFLSISSDNKDGVGYVEQIHEIDKKGFFYLINFSSKISTKNLQGKGAAISISIENEAGENLFTENMNNSMLHGNNDWVIVSLKALSVPEADRIKIGGISYGTGVAEFDDFEIELIPLEERKPNKITKKYIKTAIKICSEHSIMRDGTDFKKIKKEAFRIAGRANSYADCHLAVKYILTSMGDHHSFFMEPETVESFSEESSAEEAAIEFANYKLIENCGYVSVPAMFSGNEDLMTAFADTIQQALKKLDENKLDGWIVDLRDDMGGNMSPMIAGLGPLFSGDVLGHLIDVKNNKETWSYNKGAIYWNGEKYVAVTEEVILGNKNLPIAVLIGPRTGSSGEATAISFIGNPNTRFFGAPSWGISTGNGEFELPDGAKMFLTSTIMTDRNGKKYGNRIIPDVVIKDGEKQREKTLEAAINWIKKQ